MKPQFILNEKGISDTYSGGMMNNNRKDGGNVENKSSNIAIRNNQEKTKPQYNPNPIDDDLTFCKFCSRRYNEETFQKHAPGCERRFKEKEIKNRGSKGQNPHQNKPYGKK